jgi:hypothetical protein
MFRVKTLTRIVTLKKWAGRFSEKFVSDHNITRRQNPEELDLILHRRMGETKNA